MIQVLRYTKSLTHRWDSFVRISRNATFLFLRDFMDYHQDRFDDCSLLFENQRGEIIALFPATESMEQQMVSSHAGLTYGGLLLSPTTTSAQIIHIWQLITTYYREAGYQRLLVKPIPSIYHLVPSQEELYVLFRLQAKLVARGLSTTLNINQKPHLSTLRKRKIKKAKFTGIQYVDGGNLEEVWKILTEQLATLHKVSPVHSVEEIKKLMQAFPTQIRLFTAQTSTGEIQAATLLFLTPQVAHAQYIVASPRGRETGALDLLLDELLYQLQQKQFNDYAPQYFDFGISTENQGFFLNQGLIFQKEGFGGRGVVYDQYEINLALCPEQFPF